MDFLMNKIDPQLVKIIQGTTKTGVVHKKNHVPIREETKEEEENKKKQKKGYKNIQQTVKKLNHKVEEAELDIFLKYEAVKDQLCIKVFEKNTDQCIRIFYENEIEDFLNRLENLSGIIVDRKG